MDRELLKNENSTKVKENINKHQSEDEDGEWATWTLLVKGDGEQADRHVKIGKPFWCALSITLRGTDWNKCLLGY